MNIGNYKFYESKVRLMWIVLGCLLFLVMAVGCFLSQESSGLEKFFSLLVMMGVGVLCLPLCMPRLFMHRPFLEITPNFIKMGNHKVSWTDIASVKCCHRDCKGTDLESLWVQVDPKKTRAESFEISLLTFSKKDQQEIKSVFRKCLPNANLD